MEVDSGDEGPTVMVVEAQVHRPILDAIQVVADNLPPEGESEEAIDVEAVSDPSQETVNVEAISEASQEAVNVEAIPEASQEAVNVDTDSSSDDDEADGGNPIFGDQARLPFEFLSMKPKKRKTSKKGWGRKPKRSGQDYQKFNDRKKAILKAAAEAQAEKQREAAAKAREDQLRMEALVEAFGPSDAEEDIEVEAAPQDDGDNEAPEEHQLPENSKREIKAF